MLTPPPDKFRRIRSGSIAGSQPLDIVFRGFLDPALPYRGILVLLTALVPAADGVHLHARFSSDGGSTFGATGYNWAHRLTVEGAAPAPVETGANADTEIQLTGGDAAGVLGNAAVEASEWAIELLNPGSSSGTLHPRISWRGLGAGTTSLVARHEGHARRTTAAGIDVLRVYPAGGGNMTAQYAAFGWL